jgi:hypothetical protein
MDNSEEEDRRDLERKNIALNVLCSAGHEEGPGLLKDVSHHGAMVESTSVRPSVGDSVMILLRASPDDAPDVLHTSVVRHTDEGFAVKFRVPYSVVRNLIEKHRPTAGA